jgi:hypothetical protein
MSIMPVAMQPHGPFAYSSVFAQQFAIGPCGEAVGRTHPHTPPSAVPEQQLAVLPWALIPAPMQPHGPFAYWRLFEQQLPIGPPGEELKGTHAQIPPSAAWEQQWLGLPWSDRPGSMQLHGPFAYWRLFEQQLPIGPPGSSPGRTQPQSPPSAVAEQQLDLLPSSLIPAPMQPHGPFAYSKLFEQQSLVICPTPTESW